MSAPLIFAGHVGLATLQSDPAEKPAGAARLQPDTLLQSLPVAVYTTDAAGRITFYNEAAAALWGCRPKLGESEWCGSWRLYWPDGRPMPHAECPMATALKEGRPISGAEAVAERPDGTRIPFLAYPTPLWDESGVLVGAINTLVSVVYRKDTEILAQRLAAIVDSSDDAIIGKDLDGVIATWNPGAEKLFGYSAEEVVGRPITVLIPLDRREEETRILERLRRGERVERYDTVRRRKDGRLVEISLTVSPIRDATGRIVGASKIARDNSEHRRAQEQQRLLLGEMNHRIKNLLALAGAVTTLSARTAKSPKEMANAVLERLAALGQANELTLLDLSDAGDMAARATTLPTLIRTILAPYVADDHVSIALDGPETPIAGKAVMSIALLLHETATNAAKYGAFSRHGGRVEVAWRIHQDELFLTWRERGGPPVEAQPEAEGFGSLLERLTVTNQLEGEISRDWSVEGLTLNLRAPLKKLLD